MELQKREENRIKLQKEIQEKEQKAREIEKNFRNQDDEIEKKTIQFKQLKDDLKKVEIEGEEIQKEYEISQNEFHQEMETINQKISYSEEIIKNIIPKKYLKMIIQLLAYDEERDEFFLQGIDDLPSNKNETKKNNVFAMGDEYEEIYEQIEDEVQLKEIIEMGNQPKSVYLTYDQLKKMKNKNNMMP